MWEAPTRASHGEPSRTTTDTPEDRDSATGLGEIGYDKVFMPVMNTGVTMPLAFENIFELIVPRPTGADLLARRPREFIETVLRGLRATR